MRKINTPSSREPYQTKKAAIIDSAAHLYRVASATVSPRRQHVREYLGLMEGSEQALADALLAVANAHREEPDIYSECPMLAGWCRKELTELRKLISRYGEAQDSEPKGWERRFRRSSKKLARPSARSARLLVAHLREPYVAGGSGPGFQGVAR